MEGLTFAVLLTAAGAGIAAGLVTTLVSVIKTITPDKWPLDGAVMAFVGTAFLYVLAAVATGVSTLDAGLGVFVAWLTCAVAAVGAHKMIVKPVIKAVQGNDSA